MKIIDKFILLAFPLMEVGITFFGTPFRIGELMYFLFFLRLINIRPILKLKSINRVGFFVTLLLLINLVLFFIIGINSSVDTSFFSKYVLRNTLYLFAFVSFVLKPISLDFERVESYIRYILIVVGVFFAMEVVDYFLLDLGWDSIFVSRQDKQVFSKFFIRLSGTSSEPGYLVPLLSIPLMFGMLNSDVKVMIFSLIGILLTFSSFGYIVILLAIWYMWKYTKLKSDKAKIISQLKKWMILIGLGLLFFYNKIQELIAHNWVKMLTYFNASETKDWSAMQRAGHINLGFEIFKESSWTNIIFGNGTGHYSLISKQYIRVLDDAEEAHNLYISTLVDRGIVGLLITCLLFFLIFKIKAPKNEDVARYIFLAVKFGILVRIIHWLFTGMLWQYYFWVEVIVLLSLGRYLNKDEKR